jgi:hypothetical protein
VFVPLQKRFKKKYIYLISIIGGSPMKAKIIQAVIVGLFILTGMALRPYVVDALDLSVVGWGEADSITTSMVANNAAETSRVYNWMDNSNQTINTPSGANGTMTVDPSISVVVPSGKAYYYLLKYEGQLGLFYADRIGSMTVFRANLRVTPLSGTTPIGDWFEAAATGYRPDWSALGTNSYWATPYHSTWIVRLTEGTHDLKFKLDLIVDGTMNKGEVFYQRVQVMRML